MHIADAPSCRLHKPRSAELMKLASMLHRASMMASCQTWMCVALLAASQQSRTSAIKMLGSAFLKFPKEIPQGLDLQDLTIRLEAATFAAWGEQSLVAHACMPTP